MAVQLKKVATGLKFFYCIKEVQGLFYLIM